MKAGFWTGKRVLVTGHTGFKGGWLVAWLRHLGAEVAGLALPPSTTPNLFDLAQTAQDTLSVFADIRDPTAVKAAFDRFQPEIVFHMAAQAIVRASYDDPVGTYATNVMGTVHVFEAVRNSDVRVVVNVTSDKCYDNREWVWGYRETDRLGGKDPYSSSKSCSELVGRSYRDSFFPIAHVTEHGVAIASARAGNVIGGGDWTPRQLVPEAITAFLRAQPVVLRHPNAVRPWQHVLDCLGGYLRLAEALAGDSARYSGEWNFGPADAETRTVAGVVEALAAHWQIERPWKQDKGIHPPEELQLRLDTSKAATVLGWRGRLPVDEALRWAAVWYHDHHAGADARPLCLDQIAAYVAAGQG